MCVRKEACRQLLSNSMLYRYRFLAVQWSLCIFAAVLGHSPASLRADTKRFVLDAPGNGLPDDALSLFERDTAKLTNPSQAKKLLRLTAYPVAGPEDVNLPITDFVLIHTLRWGMAASAPRIVDQHWYVFRDEVLQEWSDEDFTTRQRILGVSQFQVMYVHLGRPPGFEYKPFYEIVIQKKVAINFQNLLGVTSLILPQPASLQARVASQPVNIWYASKIERAYVPSDVTLNVIIPGADPIPSVTIANEGLARWDVGVGVPVTKISQTSFDLTNGTIAPRYADKRSLFALLNLYVFKARDLYGSNFSWWPYPVAGVALGSRPLHNIVAAVGWGSNYANVYGGVLWSRQPDLTTSGLQNRYVPQFTFGINLTFRGLQQKLSNTR
jgi:hypothetical protein